MSSRYSASPARSTVSSRHSSSPARSAVPSRHSTPDRSDRQRSASGSPARPSPSASSRYSLGRIRVLMQDRPDPFEVLPLANTSRTFRYAVYCLTFALNLLESEKGRAAFIQTGIHIWNSWGRSRTSIRFQGDVRRYPELMDRAVDDFLAKIRSDPPNIIVSNRVPGEAETQRLNWRDWFDDGRYEAKWSVIFRLNKTVVDHAIYAADNNHREDFERFLFLTGLATAHEMVHMFVGFLTGTDDTDTPARVQFPVPSETFKPITGKEAGAYWEGKMLGFMVEAWEKPGHPLGQRQAGEMLGKDQKRDWYPVGQGWMRAWALLDFSARPERSSKPKSVAGRTQMELTDRRDNLLDKNDLPQVDKTEFIEKINRLPSHQIPAAAVADIMAMAAHPTRIRAA